MTRRYVRLAFFIALLLALGAAAYQIFLLERSLAAEQARADAVATDIAVAVQAILEIRGAERAYLAEGQGAPYWHERLQAAFTRLTASASHLRGRAASTQSAAELDELDEALGRFTKLEARISEHALAGRRPHAEDLIFADAIEASSVVERLVRAAAPVLAAESRARLRDLRERELIVAALGASVALLVALVLVPVRTREVAALPASGAAPGERDLPLKLRDAAQQSQPPVVHATGPAPASHVAVAARTSDKAAGARLLAAADLCGVLARIDNPRDLPTLLGHLTRVLDAQGTIVWLATPDGQRLEPALSHGYGQDVLTRMGVIARDAANPAAEAFRRREARTVTASDGPAAVIAPLVSAGGCVGVLTAELKAGAAAETATLALARIFAAQLATFVAPAAEAVVNDEGSDAQRAASTTAV